MSREIVACVTAQPASESASSSSNCVPTRLRDTTLSKQQVDGLGEYEEPPTSAEILPDEAGVVRRAEAAVEAPIHSHEERLTFLTRVRHAFRRLTGR